MATAEKLSIEVDMNWEPSETKAEVVAALERKFGIDLETLVEVGPAGGASVMKMTGTREQIETALMAKDGLGWGMDADDARYHIDGE